MDHFKVGRVPISYKQIHVSRIWKKRQTGKDRHVHRLF